MAFRHHLKSLILRPSFRILSIMNRLIIKLDDGDFCVLQASTAHGYWRRQVVLVLFLRDNGLQGSMFGSMVALFNFSILKSHSINFRSNNLFDPITLQIIVTSLIFEHSVCFLRL